jgi:glutaredoxin 3
MKARLFIKPYCGWCHKAMRWLDNHGVDYEVLDVMKNEAAWDEMVRISGQEMSPVIDVDGKVLADFGPEELPGFFKRISTTDGHGRDGKI